MIEYRKAFVLKLSKLFVIITKILTISGVILYSGQIRKFSLENHFHVKSYKYFFWGSKVSYNLLTQKFLTNS